MINLINYALDYAGRSKRIGDLFSEKDIYKKVDKFFKKTFKVSIYRFSNFNFSFLNWKDVPNLYSQHQPYLLTILDSIFKGKLKESEYPTTTSPINFSVKPTDVVVFMVGGTTFEEAKEIAIGNFGGGRVFLGGSTIHNTKRFTNINKNK
jgi:vacuolar protein sorting-associated protein 45